MDVYEAVFLRFLTVCFFFPTQNLCDCLSFLNVGRLV